MPIRLLCSTICWSLVCVLPCALAASDGVAGDATEKFSREIRPILAQHCFACHGPDDGQREADLRLDRRESAIDALAIVPGDADASALIARIESDDPDVVMPPSSSGHALSAEQKQLLRDWVAAGAPYAEHWSFRPIERPEPPVVGNAQWVRNPIDQFVLARLEQEGIAPSEEADRITLLRRLSFDLLGLPPDPGEVAEFLADNSHDAYEHLVDRMLASPHFGERWGRHWLDMARYADSDGYLGDALRPYAWLYRDWVINAINADLPYDQFTIEQLAGDLLEGRQLSQRVATGFLRNSLRNTEAGVDREEYRVKEIVDRLSTTGTIWLGLSIGCAECHSHKFDPISQHEFYRLFAFFNNADDVDVSAPLPGEMEKYRAREQSWQQRREQLASAMDAVFTERADGLPVEDHKRLLGALETDPEKRSSEQKAWIEQLLVQGDDTLRELCENFEKHIKGRPRPPATKAMTVAARSTVRETHIHVRGDYRRAGDRVEPGTLEMLHPFEPRAELPDRLDLARWLVDPANPLMGRVTVNHFWKHLFGRGLVASVDDFGASGEAPSHPELLDWLAREFVDGGYSRKALVRLIVTSSTYRQSSRVRPELADRDPLNVLLARQDSFRIEGELVRDAALATSGLLVRDVGGPSIRPPQPADVTSFSRNRDYQESTGGERYRRGLYILLRRATPYPMLQTFDAPDSTVACTRRERSNSPLQALTLLNDPVFFEAAQALARRVVTEAPGSTTDRIEHLFRSCLSRHPTPDELQRVLQLYDEQRAALADDASTCGHLIGAYAATDVEPVEQATWVVVGRVMMNLHEFITRD